MSFDTQTWRKQLTLLKHALRLQEVANGVFVQRIPARYLARLYDDDDSEDPVVDALRNLDDIFASCREALVDMSSSVEALLSVHEADKQSHGFVLLAWRLSFDAASRQMAEPALVGIATVSNFVSTPSFSTDAESLSRGDLAKLTPYFGARWSYLDALCSTRPGVGRLLVLHAYVQALSMRKEGLIALSFARRRAAVPESKKLFTSLNFDPLIPTADFRIQIYGTWFKKSRADLAGVAEAAMRVCTRTGLTARTADTLLWRCP